MLALVLIGCELIGEAEQLIPVPLPVDTTGRAHVLIEFTGFRCVNCPKAAEAAADLQHTYADRLIVVAMHPASNPFTQGVAQYDYTAQAADTYYRYLGGTATTSFPIGNIDFAQDDNTWLSTYPEWATLLAKRMREPAKVHLSLSARMDADTREVTVSVTDYADIEQSCRMLTWLVEDSVQGAQAMPDGSVDMQYMHRHMFRMAVGEPWGDSVNIRPIPTQRAVSLIVPEQYVIRRCAVVVVLIDEHNTIVNAKQVKL